MKVPNISESEWTVMEALWEMAPQTASQVADSLHSQSRAKWALNTVRTLLTRLEKKGALKTGENLQGTRTYQPAVTRDACVHAESDSFAQRLFGGAAKPLLMHFASRSKLTADEVEELKRLLDESAKP